MVLGTAPFSHSDSYSEGPRVSHDYCSSPRLCFHLHRSPPQINAPPRQGGPRCPSGVGSLCDYIRANLNLKSRSAHSLARRDAASPVGRGRSDRRYRRRSVALYTYFSTPASLPSTDSSVCGSLSVSHSRLTPVTNSLEHSSKKCWTVSGTLHSPVSRSACQTGPRSARIFRISSEAPWFPQRVTRIEVFHVDRRGAPAFGRRLPSSHFPILSAIFRARIGDCDPSLTSLTSCDIYTAFDLD
jgi:hypothetical protein